VLRGDPSALRLLDEWIDVALSQSARFQRSEWEDLKQEILARVFRNLSRGDFAARSTLRTYVHRISKNVCIDSERRSIRDRSGDPPAAPSTGETGSAAAACIAKDLLGKLLDGISQDDRKLLEMVFIEHLSYSEIAALLPIAEGTVKSRMFRCKTHMLQMRRALIEPKGSE
jgi:RNA polymerase sigma-70 factor (ECF subfamily)